MKLHLPTSLRRSLLACFSTVQAFFPTLAAGHVSGGLLAFAISMAGLPSVQAAETNYDGATLDSLTLNADDIANFSGQSAISGALNMTNTPITVNLADGASLTLGSVYQGANDDSTTFTHTFQTGGTPQTKGRLTVGDFRGKDCVTLDFNQVDVNITNSAQIGSGSSYTFRNGASLQFGESEPADPTSRSFIIWSWKNDSKADTLLKLEDADASFGSNLEMKEETFIRLEGKSTLAVKGNLKLAQSGGGGDKIATISSSGDAVAAVNVSGGVVLDAGFTLKVAGATPLTVAGSYNSTGASNTTLDIATGATANFDSMKLVSGATLTGGGLVTARAATGPEGASATVNVTDGTRLAITEGNATDGRYPANSRVFGVGTNATMTLSNGSSFVYGSREELDALKYLILWSWNDSRGSTLNVTDGSDLYIGGNLDMKQGTTLNVTGQKIITDESGSARRMSSRATIAGDLITSFGYDTTFSNKTATITGGKTVAVLGNVNIVEGGTLALTETKTALTVEGVYNSPNANNTTLDVDTGASAYFGGMNAGTAATIQGGGRVRSTGDIGMAENGRLAIQGQGTTLELKAKASGLVVNGNLDMKGGTVLDVTGPNGSVTTISGTLNMGSDDLTVNLAEGATLAANTLTQGDGGFTHAFVCSGSGSSVGNLEVADFVAAERMKVSFDKVVFIISKDGSQDARIGSGSTYTFANLGGIKFGLQDSTDYKARTFTISNGLMDGSGSATTINLVDGAAEIYGNLEMGANTELHQQNAGSYTVYGDLKLSSGGVDMPADQKVATLSWTPHLDYAYSTSSVKGDLVFEDGFTLKLTDHMQLSMGSGVYNSTSAANTTIDLDANAWASFYSMNIGKAGTIRGGGYVSLLTDLNIVQGGTLTIVGPEPNLGYEAYNLRVGGAYNRQGSINTTLDVRKGATTYIGETLNLANGTTLTGGGLVKANSANVPDGAHVSVTGGTRLEITEGLASDNQKKLGMGSGSSLTLSGGSSLLYGSRESVDANKTLILWSWNKGTGATLNVTEGSELYIGGNLDMKQGTTLNVTDANSTATIAGDLVTSIGGSASKPKATVTGGNAVSVSGNLNILADGALAVTGEGTALNVAGAYNSANANNTTLEVASGATATFAGMNAGTAATIQGGGHVTASGNINIAANGTLTITGEGTTLISEGALDDAGNGSGISILNGGLLQLNGGLAYHGNGSGILMTVDGTSTLGVIGNDRSGADRLTLNLASGATLALGAEGAEQTLFNHALNMDAAAGLKLRADGDARFDAAQRLELAGLQVLAGSGTMELQGDYALGRLDNAIANAGALSIAEGTTFDLTQALNGIMLDSQPAISGVHQFISNAAGASLGGFATNARIFYNGYLLNDEVTLGESGTLDFGDGLGETLYWDGYDGAAASGSWLPGSTLWSAAEGEKGDGTAGALDSIVFGRTPSGASKDVQAGSGATNGIRNVFVTEGGYAFSGEALGVGEDLTVTATGRTAFNSAVTVHGDVLMGNWENAVQGITTEVAFVSGLTAANLYVRNVAAGEAASAATGTYSFDTINVAGDVVFNVNDQRMGGYYDSTPRVLVNGALTAGSMTINGNAAMLFNGQVAITGVVTVLSGNDDHNIIQLKGGSDIAKLVLDEGAKVLLSTEKAVYNIGSIELGDATLRFDAYSTDYNNNNKGYTIYATHDNATLEAASITKNKVALLDGDKDGTGNFHSFTLYSQARTMNFGTITDLKDFTVYNGVAVVNAGAGSAGAIHGDLRALEAAMLDINANNIMAEGSGKVIVNNSYLRLRSTEQKLYANAAGTGNSLELDMAYLLGEASGTGLHAVLAQGETAGVLDVAYRQANNVGANVKLDSGTTLNLQGAAGASLTLSGVVGGAGNVRISGAGSSVSMAGASESNRLTGLVTVENGAELKLAALDALYGARLDMLQGSTLTFGTGGNFPVRLQSLNLHAGVTVNIDSIEGTNVVRADSAAIWLLDHNTLLGYEQGGALTLNFTIANGASMDQMRAYNIFASDFNFLGKAPEVGLSLFAMTVYYYNSKGERVELDSNHYVRGYLQQGDNYVYYIRTRSGNIWAGGETSGSGTWKAEDGEKLWAGMESGTKDVYHQDLGSALFVDLPGDAAEVTLSGPVAPGTVYFQAELTKFTLAGSEGNYLAGDTVIEVRGSGGVELALAGNADMDHAISGLNVRIGSVHLQEDLAIRGEVAVGGTAHLSGILPGADGAAGGNRYILTREYMASGDFSNLTLGQETIGGAAGSIGSITDADIRPNSANGAGATLEHVKLGGSGTLGNVTIGEGVSLAADGHYTLTGVTFFDNTVTMGANSSIALGEGGMIDIGGLDAEKDFSNAGSTTYTFKLLDGDLASATGGIVPNLELSSIFYNGVNLGTAVKSGVVTLQKGGAGDASLQPGEFKLVVNGADVLNWDPRWGVEGRGPSLGKANTGDAVLYDKNDGELATKYLYSNYVTEAGADNIIVASLSRSWTSSGNVFIGTMGGDKEVWVFNQGVGGFREFVVGSYKKGNYHGEVQNADTHLVITGGVTSADTVTVGGSCLVNQNAESFLTLHGEEAALKRGIVIGGTWSADQSQASHVFMDGGEILTRLVTGSYNGWVESSWLTIAGGKIAAAYGGGYWGGGVRNGAHSVLTGGTITDFYGGSQNSATNGGIEVTVDGARITNLYASNDAGTVTGDVVLNLISGSAKIVRAGKNNASLNGNFIVRLGSDFVFSNPNGNGGTDTLGGTELYGGLQTDAGVTFNGAYTSRLELVSENATYDFAGPYKGDNASHSTKIMGFSEVLLANGVTMIVHNAAFNNAQNLAIGMLGAEEEGKSLTATVVYGNSELADGHSSKGTRTGSMTLKKGITLKLGTSYAHDSINENNLVFPHLYVERGAMFDISGFPREQAYNDGGGCISFQLHLAGNGVNGQGALFKGEGFASSSPDGKAELGHVILDDNASVNADGANIIFDSANHKASYIEFDGHTLTKIGSMVLRLYQSTEGAKDRVLADGTTQAVAPGGTMYVKEGSADYRMENHAEEVDYVLGGGGTLSVTLDEAASSLGIRSLSGAGTVRLNHNTTLSMHSDYDPLNGAFYSDWLNEGEKYNSYAEGGYAYGIFSGKITSEDSSANLVKTGKGTQSLLGGQSDYRGLTIIQDGTLYLMGTSHGQLNGRGLSATMTSGAAGLSSLVWEHAGDADADPVLRLGHGTVTYNDGYARGGADMVIEVSAAPNGVGLENFEVHRGDSDEYVSWVRDGVEYRRVDVSSIKSVNVNGVYANGEAYTAGDTIDRSRALYVTSADLDKRVSADLNMEIGDKWTMHGSMEGEQLDSAKLSNGMKLDCNAYYGDGSICAAGNGLDLAKAQQWGVYVPSDVSLSPETADLLLYKASPLVYARTTEGADGAETTTYYNQYELKTPMGPGEVGQASTSQTLRQDAVYYVRYVEINNRKTQMFTVYLTYAELQALLKGKAIGDKNFAGCELVAINRICVNTKNETYNAELAQNENVELIVGEVSTVVADVPLNLQGYTVKEGVTKLSCNGYYVDARNIIVGRYLAGDEIKLPEGAVRLLVPEMFKDQAWAVVTGLSPTGYEEAVYSGMLTDDGKTASHLTKRGAGTLALDQQSIYTGDTKLEGGTLRLRGWGDLQNGMDRRGSGRFIQSAGTTLMLSYANEEKYASLGDAEVRELRKDLALVGTGDSRWRNEAETDYQTAALISDVGRDVSFTLSGVLSGDGNLLHSGEGQLHISGANTYEGGTTVTKGVTYVESSTALGTTAQGASAKVVTYAGSTLVLTNGLGGTNAAGLVGEGYVQFHSNHNSIKGTVLIGGYEKGGDIRAEGSFAEPGVGQGSTLLMSGNGYWAENTIISKNSALVFNGSGSSNYTVDGTNREVRVDQSAENKAGHLGGAGKLVVSGPAGKGLAVYFDNIGESAEGKGDNFTGGIRVEGNNSRLFFGQGDYAATAENGGINVSGYFSRLNAEKSNITVKDGGNVTLSSLGYYSNPNLNATGTGTQGAAGIRAQSVTVEKGGTLAARNAPTYYRYNLDNLAEDTQLSTEDALPGNRKDPAPVYSEETKGLWRNVLGSQVGSLSAAEGFEPYKKAYDTNLAVNKNRAASVNAQVTFKTGSCYEAYFANTRLGQGASLTLESGGGAEGTADNRIVLDLSTNGNALKWGKGGIGISQIVLFTDVENLVFKYGDTIIDTSDAAYDGTQIFYAAAKDFFREKSSQGLYLSDDTYVVYDKAAQIVYLDATTPEPATATLSLLALAALCARRRRRK